MERCENCNYWKDPDIYHFGKCKEIYKRLCFTCDDPHIIVVEVETPHSFGCILFKS
uniref:Uncharacterized protein n=1 Tax=viral metagenome TaxID=1070528 RepID=A0A6M3ITT0_9ZZZZ